MSTTFKIPNSPGDPFTDLLNALSSEISGVASGKATSSQLLSSTPFNSNITDFLNDQTYTSGRPKAYINWMVFDDQFRYDSASSGFEQVGADEVFTEHTRNNLTIPKSGYLYIYVSNVTPNINVFFDNLQVTHVRGPLLEETHYYPFGLTMNGISSKALSFGYPHNKHKFNSGNELQSNEFSDGSGLEMFDAVNRMYDPQIGRFWQVDELAEANWEWSPYEFTHNNPILYNDPWGLDPETSTPDKPKELSEVVVVAIPKGQWAKQNLYYDIMDQLNRRGATIDQILQPSLRQMMYNYDGITKHREIVAAGVRETDKIALTIASFFIPVSWLTKLKYLKGAINVFKLRRGFVITEKALEKIGMKELQVLARKYSDELNRFFNTNGGIIPSKETLLVYKELATRILTETKGAYQVVTTTVQQVQTERLQLIEEALKMYF